MNSNIDQVPSNNETMITCDSFLDLLKSLQSPEQLNCEERALEIWRKKKENLKLLITEAYTATDQKYTLIAIAKYKQILNEFEEHKYNEEYGYSDEELGVMLFLLSLLYLEVREYSHVVKAMKMLEICEPLLSNHSSMIKFGLAKSYYLLNRFKKSMDIIKEATDALDNMRSNEKEMPPLLRPVTHTVINESCPRELRSLLEGLLESCRCVSPIGTCRYENCLRVGSHFLPSTSIYQNDLYYTGFVRIICESGCKIEYHLPCWKKLRNTLSSASHKNHLHTVCQTSDCVKIINSKKHRSKIIEIKIYNCDGSLKSTQNTKNDIDETVKGKSNSSKGPRSVLSIKRNINSNNTSTDESSTDGETNCDSLKENLDSLIEKVDLIDTDDKTESITGKMYSIPSLMFKDSEKENLEHSSIDSERRRDEKLVTPLQFMSNNAGNPLQPIDNSIRKNKDILTPTEFVKRISKEEITRTDKEEKIMNSKEIASKEERIDSCKIKEVDDKQCQTVSSEMIDDDKEKYIQHLENQIAKSETEKCKLQSSLDLLIDAEKNLKSTISKLERKSQKDSTTISKLQSLRSFHEMEQQNLILLHNNLKQYCLLLIDANYEECRRVIQTNTYILQANCNAIPPILLRDIQIQNYQWNEHLGKIQSLRYTLLGGFVPVPRTGSILPALCLPDIATINNILARKPRTTSDMVLLCLLNQSRIQRASMNHFFNLNMQDNRDSTNCNYEDKYGNSVDRFMNSYISSSNEFYNSAGRINKVNLNVPSIQMGENIKNNHTSESDGFIPMPNSHSFNKSLSHQFQHTGAIPKIKQEVTNTVSNVSKCPSTKVEHFFKEFQKQSCDNETFNQNSVYTEAEDMNINSHMNAFNDLMISNQRPEILEGSQENFDNNNWQDSTSPNIPDNKNWESIMPRDIKSDLVDAEINSDINKLQTPTIENTNTSSTNSDKTVVNSKINGYNKNCENSLTSDTKSDHLKNPDHMNSENSMVSDTKSDYLHSEFKEPSKNFQNSTTPDTKSKYLTDFNTTYEQPKNVETVRKGETKSQRENIADKTLDTTFSPSSTKRSISFGDFMDKYLPRMFPTKTRNEIRTAYYAIILNVVPGSKPREIIGLMIEYFKSLENNDD